MLGQFWRLSYWSDASSTGIDVLPFDCIFGRLLTQVFTPFKRVAIQFRFGWLQLLGWALLSASSAEAASFTTACNSLLERRNGCSIELVGTIVSGDADRLLAILSNGSGSPHGWFYLVLDSGGGDVVEALKVADVVRQALLETTTVRIDVPPEIALRSPERQFLRCASACFLVWSAGARRHHYSAEIEKIGHVGLGLHRPSFSKDAYSTADIGQLARESQAVAEMVRQYLRREAIPEQLIEEMMRRSSREIMWLDDDEKSTLSIPEMAPWYEEMLIARCNFDPAKLRLRKAISQAGRGNPTTAEAALQAEERFRKHKLYKTYEELGEWLTKVRECERESIRLPAQAKFVTRRSDTANRTNPSAPQ